VARTLGVDKSTVVKWVQKGLFKNVSRPGGTGQYRIPLSSYEEFVRSQKNL
ncbi:MAG: helix-turn-helix domain-containing protein, partial [Caldilineaceae bacterium]|nr:helix-turn-helix domain-containing protein [Caldilineaceae bacterium]